MDHVYGCGVDRRRGTTGRLLHGARVPSGAEHVTRGCRVDPATDASGGPHAGRIGPAELRLCPVPQGNQGGPRGGRRLGQGVVYERGRFIGYSSLSQASVGLQAGAQTFSELLLFEDKATLDRFKAGALDFAAEASAVILQSGVATTANFVDGVAVAVRPIGGAMLEASIGGQQFAYQGK
jgi:hypothetical protein